MSFDGLLKGLETEGGKMLVIIFMLLFILAADCILIMSGHPLQETGREMNVGAVSSLLGILYGYLKASGGK